jgi:hypothetical protein
MRLQVPDLYGGQVLGDHCETIAALANLRSDRVDRDLGNVG